MVNFPSNAGNGGLNTTSATHANQSATNKHSASKQSAERSSTTQLSTTQLSSTVVNKREDGTNTTISARLSSTYSYTETRYTPSSSPAPSSTYTPHGAHHGAANLHASRPTEGAENAGTATADDTGSATNVVAAGESQPRNDGANTILAYIEQRLAMDMADGASAEQLQSRLQAGFEGFMQGYSEAAAQLEGMGLLSGDVQAAVEQTFNQVVNGITELAQQYGLDNPAANTELFAEMSPQSVAAGPAPAQANNQSSISPEQSLNNYVESLTDNQAAQDFQALIAPSQSFYERLDEEQSESRLYSLQLRTNDGDVVTIRSYADRGERTQSDRYEGGRQQYDASALNDFRLSVDGELDVGELSAISGLLTQLNDVADSFFEGDIYQAYEQAQQVGYDSSEIARFSLNLTQVEYTRIETTYGAVANGSLANGTATQSNIESLKMGDKPQQSAAPAVDNRVARMAEFVRRLDGMREQFQERGLDAKTLVETTEFVGRPKYGKHPDFQHFQPFLNDMVAALANRS